MSHSAAGWVVHKFGGTSVATSECYRNAASILLAIDSSSLSSSSSSSAPPPPSHRKCAVVSAMGELKPNGQVSQLVEKYSNRAKTISTRVDKVTSQLIRATELAAAQDDSYHTYIESLKNRHIDAIHELLSFSESEDNEAVKKACIESRDSLIRALHSDLNDLSYILRACWLSKSWDEKNNWWFGYGEIWSARLFSAFLNHYQFAQSQGKEIPQPSVWLDARDVIILAKSKDVIPEYKVSQDKLNIWLNKPENKHANIVVATGYIASSHSGTPTTLGRDGSDYSASIFAALLKARHATIWTDVDGVYSANPSQVSEAVILDEMSYDEASELAYFGAKVLHPKTMIPVISHEIPIFIRNTFNPSHPGTCIASQRAIASGTSRPLGMKAIERAPDACVLAYGVKGFSEVRNLALVNMQGSGMIGVPGQAQRLFDSLKRVNCNVILITQGGSEHSISFAVPLHQGVSAKDAVSREFRDDLLTGEIQSVDLISPVACLAIVGDGMSGQRGIAGRFFSALADANVNIMAIAQGSSERNISVIVEQEHVAHALASAHRAFLSKTPNKPYSPLLTRKEPPPSISVGALSLTAVTAPPLEVPSDGKKTVVERLGQIRNIVRATQEESGIDAVSLLVEGMKDILQETQASIDPDSD